MTLTWTTVTVDSREPEKLARFWSEALGTDVTASEWGGFQVSVPVDGAPGLYFTEVPEGKSVKNRLHFDLIADDQHAEVERLLSLGATRADIGQGDDATWTVLRDPEGNEFCVL